MSLREVITYPSPILRKKSAVVEEVNEDLKQLVEDMAETMYASHGIGLAAIQIGIPKRVIVINVGEGLVVLVNPVIDKAEGETRTEEGCLCLPGVMVEVTRHETITVSGLSEAGQEVTIHAEGLMARALQHEIDHLEGTLIVDKVSRVKRELLTSALRKEAKAAP
jgi:peptide deformylase